MDDLEECSRILNASYLDSILDPSPETYNALENACQEMEVAMDTALSVASNAYHIRCESEDE